MNMTGSMNKFLEFAMDVAADGHTVSELKQCYGPFDRQCIINLAMMLRKQDDDFTVPNQPKNNVKSEQFRKLGNRMFSLKKWFGALECYNKSICFATKNSEQLGIGYANRSAIYLELKEYALCLENIALARKAGLPDRLMDKLNRREEECSETMEWWNDGNGNPNIYQMGKEVPKLSRKAHPQVPFIADCLEMKTNADQGRHIVTNDDLKPGEIVAIEDAFVCGIYETFNYRRCTYCTKENMLSLLPCDACTNTMFCTECANGAEVDYHKYECPITYFLAAFDKTRFVLRLFVRAVQSFPSHLERDELMKESPNYTVFSFNQTEPLSAKQKYLQVHSLVTNDDKQSDMDMLLRAIYSTIVFKNFMAHTDLEEMLRLDTDVAVLANVINHCFQIVPQNGHILSSSDAKETEDIGGAIYPFASLLNHSCSPNVFRVSSGTKIVVVVLRNIKKGEQLLDCYVSHYNSKQEPQDKRRASIKDALHFDCKCIACVNNYPLGINYRKGNIPAFQPNGQASDLSVKQRIEDCSKYLEKYDHNYPCVEVDLAQEVLIRCMNDLYGNVSAKCNFKTGDEPPNQNGRLVHHRFS